MTKQVEAFEAYRARVLRDAEFEAMERESEAQEERLRAFNFGKSVGRLESGKRPRLDLVALFFGYLIGIATIAVMTWIYAGRPLWH